MNVFHLLSQYHIGKMGNMLPSIKLLCINNHMTNSCCRGGDIKKQITLYK